MEIFAYAFGIMYTPGPVNLISLNAGLQGQAQKSLGFCVGVGLAMLILFMIFGYTGAWLVSPEWQRPIAILGAIYILYLVWKIVIGTLRQNHAPTDNSEEKHRLVFRNGLIMQLLNPKAPVAILPIATVQFPAAQIEGAGIAVWSFLLACMAFGAPSSYLLIGAKLGKLVQDPIYFKVINLALAALLLWVAVDILATSY